MKKSFSHITPLGTMNFITTLVNILEGVLRPDNLSNKADQALFEMYFVFAAIWAFGGALVEKDGINYRRNFDKWWKQTWTTVKLPGRWMNPADYGGLLWNKHRLAVTSDFEHANVICGFSAHHFTALGQLFVWLTDTFAMFPCRQGYCV